MPNNVDIETLNPIDGSCWPPPVPTYNKRQQQTSLLVDAVHAGQDRFFPLFPFFSLIHRWGCRPVQQQQLQPQQARQRNGNNNNNPRPLLFASSFFAKKMRPKDIKPGTLLCLVVSSKEQAGHVRLREWHII